MRKMIVRDQQFNPLRGVDVELFDPDTGKLLKVARTDQTGLVSFDATGKVAYRPRITRHSGKLGTNSLPLIGAVNLYPLPMLVPPLPVFPSPLPEAASPPPSSAPSSTLETIFSFVGTGFGFDLLQRYDVDTDTWTELTDYPAYPDYLLAPPVIFASLNGQKIFYPVEDENSFLDLIARSFDGGVTWDTVATPNDRVLRFSIGSDEQFWVFSSDGIYSSADFGSTWTLSKSATPVLNVTGGLEVNTFDSDRIAALYGVHTSGAASNAELHALVSTDGGTTWTDNQIDTFTWTSVGESCTINWLNNGRLVVAFARTVSDADTTAHIFYSDDDGVTWTEASIDTVYDPSDGMVIGDSVFIYVSDGTDGFVLRGDGASFTTLTAIVGANEASLSKHGSDLYILGFSGTTAFERVVKAETLWNLSAKTDPEASATGVLSHTYNIGSLP